MAPLYDFHCDTCGKAEERFLHHRDNPAPSCCEKPMTRLFSGTFKIKWAPPLWVSRMEDIHKQQAQRGERLRYIHPAEVGAT